VGFVVIDETEFSSLGQSSGWPKLHSDALHGLAGDVVRVLEPHTEADPAGLLVTFLSGFGSIIGPGPHAIADAAIHPARLWPALVGRTSRSRKGTTWANIRRLLVQVDPVWASERVVGGLASGEGLIAAAGGTQEKDDFTPSDSRLFVYEPEFARVLRVCARESSTLSSVLRDAWDRGDLRVMTRKDPLVACGAHISVTTHITQEELDRLLTDVDVANGFGNRFLFIAVKRSKRLPDGGSPDQAELSSLAERVSRAVARATRVDRVRRSPEADVLWRQIYNELDDDEPGLAGALTARAEAQMLRLSVCYALLDGSDTIDVQHLLSAQAVWRYAEDSVRYLFGGVTGDRVEDRLLQAIAEAGPNGLDGTGQRDVFSRHITRERLDRARKSLESKGLIVTITERTGGRPRIVSRIALEAFQATKDPQDGTYVA
jgi:hypothetical protein